MEESELSNEMLLASDDSDDSFINIVKSAVKCDVPMPNQDKP